MFERPKVLKGFTVRMKTGLGNLYVTVNEHKERPVEVFATVGKSGQSIAAKTEAVGRLVSLLLRHGVDVKEIIGQLKGIAGDSPLAGPDGVILSVPDAVAKVLEEFYCKKNQKPKN